MPGYPVRCDFHYLPSLFCDQHAKPFLCKSLSEVNQSRKAKKVLPCGVWTDNFDYIPTSINNILREQPMHMITPIINFRLNPILYFTNSVDQWHTNILLRSIRRIRKNENDLPEDIREQPKDSSREILSSQEIQGECYFPHLYVKDQM